jgi:hypothetical protein
MRFAIPVPATTENEVELVRLAGGLNVTSSMISEVDQRIMVWWRDPHTNTTLAMWAHDIKTVDDVRRHIEESRSKFFNGHRATESRRAI